MEWQLQEIFVYYDIDKGLRGRENYHVSQFGVPELDYIDVNTTIQTPEESLKIIAKKTGLYEKILSTSSL